MSFGDFANLYREKTDEELIELAASRADLVPEAQSAIAAELSRRRLEVQSAVHSTSSVAAVRPKTPAEIRLCIPIWNFVEKVLQYYRKARWGYISIAFSAVLMSYIAVTVTRHEARLIARHVYPGVGMRLLNGTLLKVTLISAIGWLISWVAFSVAFAVICSITEQQYASFNVSVIDGLSEITARIGSFLRLSITLLLIFSGLIMLSFFTSDALYSGLRHVVGLRRPVAITTASYAVMALVLLIFSRMSLAMPAFILDNLGVTEAIFRSLELTKRKWSILSVLLFKSVVGGYVAGMLPFWLARLFLSTVYVPAWFQWVLVAISIGAVAAVEPLMFIGFALLYLKTTETSADLCAAATTP